MADAAHEAFIAGASKGLLVAIDAAALGALLALRYVPVRTTAESAPATEGAGTAPPGHELVLRDVLDERTPADGRATTEGDELHVHDPRAA